MVGQPAYRADLRKTTLRPARLVWRPLRQTAHASHTRREVHVVGVTEADPDHLRAFPSPSDRRLSSYAVAVRCNGEAAASGRWLRTASSATATGGGGLHPAQPPRAAATTLSNSSCDSPALVNTPSPSTTGWTSRFLPVTWSTRAQVAYAFRAAGSEKR